MSTTNASTAGPSSLMDSNYGKRSLKKNQCDAAQPQCTNCVRAWQLLQETPELAPDGVWVPSAGLHLPTTLCSHRDRAYVRIPEAPECHYDPVEGLVFVPESISDPIARSKAIQEQLAQLQMKLQEARDDERQTSKKRPSSSGSGSASNSASKKRRHTGMDGDGTADNSDNSQSRAKRPRAGTTFTIHEPVPTSSILDPALAPNGDRPSGSEAGPSRQQTRLSAPDTSTPRVRSRSLSADDIQHGQLQSLLDAFVTNDPHASRIFHVRNLRTAFKKYDSSSTDPQSPSRALVHAICAVGARYMTGPAPVPASASGSATPTTRPNDRPDVDPLFASFPSMKGLLNLHSAIPKSKKSKSKSAATSTVNASMSGDASPPSQQNAVQAASGWKQFAALQATRARQLINAALARHQAEEEQSMCDPFASAGMTRSPGQGQSNKEKAARDAALFKDVLQPLLVLTTFYYHEARAIELWANIGALSRNAMDLRLDSLRRASASGGQDEAILEAERARALWSTFILDRFVSLGGGVHAMRGEDSSGKPEWLRLPPMARKTFNDLGTPLAVFDTPPVGPISDSFALLIDASIMLGRVTEARNRPQMKRRSPTSQSSAEFSAFHGHPEPPQLSNTGNNNRWELLRLYAVLDDGIGAGCRGNGGVVPVRFKHPIGIVDNVDALDTVDLRNGKLDTDLFLAHMVHHATMILLTFSLASFAPAQKYPPVLPSMTTESILTSFLITPEATTALGAARRRSLSSGQPRESSPTRVTPYNNASSVPATPASVSPPQIQVVLPPEDRIDPPTCTVERTTEACVSAARSVVDALTLIRATSFDITRLHPFVSTCWYLAAVVLLHEHRRCGLIGDIMKKAMTAREVQMLRLALLKYGARSPIGNHHERQLTLLLDQIMSIPVVDTAGDDNGGIDVFNEMLLGNTTPVFSSGPVSFQLPHIPIFPFDPASSPHDLLYETAAPLPDICV
ncbi:hypothetical protein FRB98_007664 [Tulasnella sp. 332]|nr:hypothetical protein FRB98_007664 [Tulasnella sp. 332]